MPFKTTGINKVQFTQKIFILFQTNVTFLFCESQEEIFKKKKKRNS